MEKVKILNKSNFSIPEYATEHSSGVDLRANIKEPVILKTLERVLIPTGIFLEIPEGIEAQIRPRSGLAIKKGLTVLNTPGTIDSDYRGEIGIIVINLSKEEITIEPGERICQMVFSRYEKVMFENVDTINQTKRGSGGFGSTGIK
ncbi:MAG: dUTP diphosphatase [Candidatus Hydrogenedens sp.]|nr:dUTP diphosphatase [Candidatus Hydrogenedens sp.]